MTRKKDIQLRCFFISLLLELILSSCSDYSSSHIGFSKLEQIKSEGELKVLTRYSPTTYYETQEGIRGLEYELAVLFAKHLNVKVKFIIPSSFEEVITQISEGKADIAAAGLTITEQRQQQVRFGTSYQSITEQIIYRSDAKKPKNIPDLKHGILEITQGTSYLESLTKIQSKHPDLSWNVNSEQTTNGLMYLVNEGLIDYTIADSHQARRVKRFYPKLSIAFDISDKRKLAWALALSDDHSLYDEVDSFFTKIKKDKTLDHLLDKYYGNADNLNYVGNCTFRQHIKSRLIEYEPFFREQEKIHAIDWRLLAAIGYQESHWLSDAISPTGVKGLMMLTRDTAKQVGVADRTDPQQSIIGGALYFKEMLTIMTKNIPEPDRTWLALASYNIGFGHLNDARSLTKKRNGNPNKWLDVKKSLPLLGEEKWYKQTKYGYARGGEPVRYVDNIRSYYDLLVWLTEENKIEKKVMALKSEKPQIAGNEIPNSKPPVL